MEHVVSLAQQNVLQKPISREGQAAFLFRVKSAHLKPGIG